MPRNICCAGVILCIVRYKIGLWICVSNAFSPVFFYFVLCDTASDIVHLLIVAINSGFLCISTRFEWMAIVCMYFVYAYTWLHKMCKKKKINYHRDGVFTWLVISIVIVGIVTCMHTCDKHGNRSYFSLFFLRPQLELGSVSAWLMCGQSKINSPSDPLDVFLIKYFQWKYDH